MKTLPLPDFRKRFAGDHAGTGFKNPDDETVRLSRSRESWKDFHRLGRSGAPELRFNVIDFFKTSLKQMRVMPL